MRKSKVIDLVSSVKDGIAWGLSFGLVESRYADPLLRIETALGEILVQLKAEG